MALSLRCFDVLPQCFADHVLEVVARRIAIAFWHRLLSRRSTAGLVSKG